MTPILTLIYCLYLIAFVTFVLAAIGVASRVNLVALGLACYALTWLLRGT